MYGMHENWFNCFGMMAAWWVTAAFFLYLSWNWVLAKLSSLGTMKFWQALLVVFSCAVWCGPAYMAQSRQSCRKTGHCSTCGQQRNEDLKASEREQMIDDLIEGEPGETVLPEAP